jgi:uncharacterized protein YndB with AHSA1/START domain
MAATDTSPATETTLRLTRTLPAPPEEVFRAWTEREALKSWFAPSLEFETTIHELDVRPGGRYRVEMKSPEGQVHVVAGIYREVTPPRRLVYTWRWETPSSLGAADTRVTLDFHDRPGGGTELVLTHENFPGAPARDEHDKGWNGCLDRLGRYVA